MEKNSHDPNHGESLAFKPVGSGHPLKLPGKNEEVVFLSEKVTMKNLRDVFKIFTALTEHPCIISSTHVVAYKCLQLHFQGTGCLL